MLLLLSLISRLNYSHDISSLSQNLESIIDIDWLKDKNLKTWACKGTRVNDLCKYKRKTTPIITLCWNQSLETPGLQPHLTVLSVELPGGENCSKSVLLFPHSRSLLHFSVNFWGLKWESWEETRRDYLLSGVTYVFSSKLFRILWKLENRHIQL